MNAEPLSPLETILCDRCATACDLDDNFCRHCGMALSSAVRLPSVRNGANLPAVWQPRLRGAIVRGAAFVAAGTLAEVLLRRMVGRALAPLAGRPRRTRRRTELVASEGAATDGARIESETLLLRHIRIRR